MPPQPDLLERSAELKHQLLEFSERPRYKRAFEPFLEQYFPGKLVLDEARFANLLGQMAASRASARPRRRSRPVGRIKRRANRRPRPFQ